MGPEKETEQPQEASSAAAPTSQGPRRGGRRSGRGHRGRGRGRRSHQEQRSELSQPPQESQPKDLSGTEASHQEPTSLQEKQDFREEVPEKRRASPHAVQQAIEEVNHIIDNLRETLDTMDEVLETLELAERQQGADEQEIERLRRALRPLHRNRESER